MAKIIYLLGVKLTRADESVVRPATCAVKNLILAMNGEKPIAQVNPEVPVKKVV